MQKKGYGILQEGAGSRKGRVGRVRMSCLHLSLGSLGPPEVKQQSLVSWAQSQMIYSIVCSGHPLGQQGRGQERLVFGAASE